MVLSNTFNQGFFARIRKESLGMARRRFGRLLEKVAVAGIRVMRQLKSAARRMQGGPKLPVDRRRIILSEMLELAKGLQQSNLTNEVDES